MNRLKNFFHRNQDAFWLKWMPVVNLLLVAVCIWGNSVSNAGFCRPVLWAAVLQGVSFLNIITFTWLERTRLRGWNALLCGISTGVYAYWCLFLGGWVVVMPVPVWFLLLLLWRNLIKPAAKGIRIWYVTGIVLCVFFALGAGKAYRAWRPPLHDPALVLGMRLNGGRDPLDGMSLQDRVARYHIMYPNRPVKSRCACSKESELNGYFTDTLWML